MRQAAILIIAASLILALGCTRGDRSSLAPVVDPEELYGDWFGSFALTVPGPDDGPVTNYFPMAIDFTASEFGYDWTVICDGDYGVAGHGYYSISGSQITFEWRGGEETNPHKQLSGVFDLELIDSVVSLSRIQRPGNFPITQTIMLQRGAPG